MYLLKTRISVENYLSLKSVKFFTLYEIFYDLNE